MDERKASRSTNVACNKQAGVHGFELPSRTRRAARMAVQYFSCSSHRVRTPSSVRSGPAQCRRCETAKSTMGLSRSLSRSSIQIQAWPVLQTRSKSRSWAPANVSSCWCQQGPSDAPASPLLPSRLEARLPLRPLSSSLGRITFSFLRVMR